MKHTSRTAWVQQMCGSVELCRCMRLLLANSCAALRSSAGACDCPLPAAVLLCEALQRQATAPCQQLCCSVWPCRRRKLPLASSCAALCGPAGAEDCSLPAGVRVCEALQLQKTAWRQQMCGLARHYRCRRLPKASSCAALWSSASVGGCHRPVGVGVCAGLQVQGAARRQQMCGSVRACRHKRLPHALQACGSVRRLSVWSCAPGRPCTALCGGWPHGSERLATPHCPAASTL